jgi:phosphoribosylamine---glycine ligase
MRILFISKTMIAADISRRLQNERHEVKLVIDNTDDRDCFVGIVPRVDVWEPELDWVGTDGLIVFDDIGYGDTQAYLRSKGYQVVGGGPAEILETDRDIGQQVMKELGMKTVPLHTFASPAEAAEFVSENAGQWVIKQNDHISKDITYVGQRTDGRDVLSILQNYAMDPSIAQHPITLHQHISGVEIGIGRYFNGNDWVGPIEINFEHKKFFPGDLGPMTSEMGTLMWLTDDEDMQLYTETLAPFKQYLTDHDFRGDFAVNCIVNETGIYPLELTARFGTPAVHLQTELFESPWGEFLLAIARGESYNLKYKKGYGVVMLLAIPPFPYTKGISRSRHAYTNIFISFDHVPLANIPSIHFEEIARDGLTGDYRIAGSNGYVAYVTGHGSTAEEAQAVTVEKASQILIPKCMYRTDIGSKFIMRDRDYLRTLGIITFPTPTE